jgi:hypothetical protein
MVRSDMGSVLAATLVTAPLRLMKIMSRGI